MMPLLRFLPQKKKKTKLSVLIYINPECIESRGKICKTICSRMVKRKTSQLHSDNKSWKLSTAKRCIKVPVNLNAIHSKYIVLRKWLILESVGNWVPCLVPVFKLETEFFLEEYDENFFYRLLISAVRTGLSVASNWAVKLHKMTTLTLNLSINLLTVRKPRYLHKRHNQPSEQKWERLDFRIQVKDQRSAVCWLKGKAVLGRRLPAEGQWGQTATLTDRRKQNAIKKHAPNISDINF